MSGSIPLGVERLPAAEVERRARAFAADLTRRRTVREFSPEPVPRSVVAACLGAGVPDIGRKAFDDIATFR